MTPTPPPGSDIAVTTSEGALALVVPQREEGFARVFGALFLAVWMGFWVLGFRDVSQQLLAGKGNAFMAVWLTAWTLGGGFALRMLYLQLRPSQPAVFVFKPEGLCYDSGYARPKFDRRADPFATFRGKRRREIFSSAELRSLALRETEAGNRLTIDRGVERIDLAPNAGEIERQWLYGVLRAQFRL